GIDFLLVPCVERGTYAEALGNAGGNVHLHVRPRETAVIFNHVLLVEVSRTEIVIDLVGTSGYVRIQVSLWRGVPDIIIPVKRYVPLFGALPPFGEVFGIVAVVRSSLDGF